MSGMSHFDNDWLLSFRVMWTPRLVQLVYILGIIVSTIICYSTVKNSSIADRLIGLFLLVVANIFWRITCEGVVVIFSIHRELTVVSDELRQIRREAAATEEREHE